MCKNNSSVWIAMFVFWALVAGPGRCAAAGKKAPDTVLLKAPLGAVRFNHKLHQERAAGKCETCHHPSKPEKPATALQQACSDCHTHPATPPMKTALQGAFHNPTATGGTCIDCHKTANAQGKKAPMKCLDCHKKTNV